MQSGRVSEVRNLATDLQHRAGWSTCRTRGTGPWCNTRAAANSRSCGSSCCSSLKLPVACNKRLAGS